MSNFARQLSLSWLFAVGQAIATVSVAAQGPAPDQPASPLPAAVESGTPAEDLASGADSPTPTVTPAAENSTAEVDNSAATDVGADSNPNADPSAKGSVDEAAAVASLGRRQTELAQKYQRLEMLMLKMAEFNADSDPRRAALLKQALARSKDQQITPQMLELIVQIQNQQLSKATTGQSEVRTDLAQILELLLSEDRADRLQEEQDRIKSYIKEVERMIRLQRGIIGRNEGGEEAPRIAQEQAKTADRAAKLGTDIEQNERPAGSANAPAAEPQPAETEPAETEPAEGQPAEGQPAEGQPAEGQPAEGQPAEGQPAEGQPAEGQPAEGQPAEGQPTEGQPAEVQPAEGPPPTQPEFPGQRRIQEAEKKMRDAQRRLEDAQRQEALEPQRDAQRLLEQAKAELEEILRQMREEEVERTLAMLEARFRKMLEMQIKVYEDTQQLNVLEGAQRSSQIVVQSGKLSLEERRILAEADKAILLLQEEGSSVAFPEAADQARDDMEQVVERLGEAQVDALTIGLEEDIIAALEEIIAALQKAQQDAEQRRQQPQQPNQPMAPDDVPLVDAIAELKMIRALQMRVNKRTQMYAKMLADPEHVVGQATDAKLLESLNQLAEREERIREITRDIVLEKNK